MVFNNIPLALYVHLPWCVRKCPYCDFNSYNAPAAPLYRKYIDSLLHELTFEAQDAEDREIISIYFGGGTPSLFPPEMLGELLHKIKESLNVSKNAEISMEVNPGTVNAEKFQQLHDAGFNRISLGIQSLNDNYLNKIHRIHDRDTALLAIQNVKKYFNNFNLDLMHSLPEQPPEDAIKDLSEIIASAPQHISWYQLTLEENTPFGLNPPKLPQDEDIETITIEGYKLLKAAGYKHYEVSAFSRNKLCIHNTNYWEFGDYLALGAGAHSKITKDGVITRKSRLPDPLEYIAKNQGDDYAWIHQKRVVSPEELPFEYFLNRLRLFSPISFNEYTERTGLSINPIISRFEKFSREGLITLTDNSMNLTEKGHLFVNHILEEFL